MVAAEAIVDGAAGALVEVEVENHGALYAEPLAFRFTPRTARGAAPGAPLEVLRVDFPHHGRAGGAVDPRGKRRYPLLVRLEADAAEACDVSVVRASFAAAAFTLDDPVAIGRLERAAEFRGELQRTIDVTRVTLENRSAHELDAVLRATYRAPKKAETLLRYRLAAGERREVAIEELPVGGGGTWSGAAVVELELVDACALLDDGAEAAAALFREAYGAWRALPADAPTLGARYALSQTVPGATLEASGAFVLRPDGTVELAPDAPGDDLAARAARSALREALAPVRRPSADEVLGATRVALIAWGETSIVRLDSASFQDGQRDLHLWLEGGRIVADGLSPKAPTRLWTLRDEGPGYVVTARVHPVDFQTAPQQETRLAYTRVGALVLPSAWSDVQLLEAFPESAKRFRLTLDGWAVGVDPTRTARPRRRRASWRTSCARPGRRPTATRPSPPCCAAASGSTTPATTRCGAGTAGWRAASSCAASAARAGTPGRSRSRAGSSGTRSGATSARWSRTGCACSPAGTSAGARASTSPSAARRWRATARRWWCRARASSASSWPRAARRG